ncbi:MAG TPA: hypothetical protein VI912_03145 [Candidatus Bilamarchaeaceae archaeon]|nr:hypothetical protein [Candidatus Bilamarchaeaceae archaeon]
MADYLLRIEGAKPGDMDPEVNTKYITKNPFGFTQVETVWTWVHSDGRSFSLSAEPPGLQVSFDNVNPKDEKSILKYIQDGTKEPTRIIRI